MSTAFDPDDEAVLRVAATGEGAVELTPDMLVELAQAAQMTFASFRDLAEQLVTPERAASVRALRVDQVYTWRAVARACFEAWGGTWDPPSNQLMGMAICESAAKHFGEAYMEEPWN